MGNAESQQINRMKSHNVPLRLPMPADNEEIDERFDRVMVSLYQDSVK